MKQARADAGFTLIEVLAVVSLTAVVIGVALNFYVQLGRDTNRAAASTRDIRRATAILDRVARDFEGTLLLRKEPDVDPLTHPWVFVAESRSSELGADHVKFDTRNHQPRGSDVHEADFAVVAYVTRTGFDDGVDLLRWTSSQLPESLDRDFPLPEDEGVLLLAEGLADFGVRFLGEDGEWTDSWDSSLLLDSGEVPVAVEIDVALRSEDDEPGTGEAVVYSRVVRIPLRPIDPSDLTPTSPEAVAGPGGGQGEGAAGTPDSGLPESVRDRVPRDLRDRLPDRFRNPDRGF